MARHQMRGSHSGGNAVQKGRFVRKKKVPQSWRDGRRAVWRTQWQLQKRAMDKGGYSTRQGGTR